MKCGFCGGLGYTVMRSETKNGVTTTYDNRGNINTTTANSNVNSGPAYNNNSGNNNNSTYTMVTCTVCNGTGLRPNTADDLSYYKENIPYIHCQQCGQRHKSGDSHQRCGACDGTGKRQTYKR